VERTFSCPYSCLRLTGNIRLFLTLSLPHSHFLTFSQLPHLNLSLSCLPLRVCLQHFNFSVWESIAASAGPQGPLQWLLIVTWCAPAGESGDIKELVCVVCHRTQQGAAITETDERRSALPLLLTQSILAPSSTECTLGQAQEQISIQVFYITTSWSYL